MKKGVRKIHQNIPLPESLFLRVSFLTVFIPLQALI